MRSLAIIRGLISLLVVAYGPCLLGCGGKVDRQYQPSARIETWSNSEFAEVLDAVVTPEGYVRHEMLEKNTGGVREKLFRYVGKINAAGPENRPDLFPTEKDRLAYYCNAYNAVCMYLVVKRDFPANMKTSGIFFLDSVPVGGKNMNLDYLEKTYLRPVDSRIHFAINCMSASCPPLRNEPYEASRLDAQLDEQGRRFLSDPRGVVMKSTDSAEISEIFRFFTKDFTDTFASKNGREAASVLEAIQPYAADGAPIRSATRFEYQDYDWSLNRPR